MIAALRPRPPIWPVVIISYWVIALSPPLLVFGVGLLADSLVNHSPLW